VAASSRALLFGAVLMLSACNQKSQGTRVSAEPEVVLLARAGELHVKVELARSDPERQRGLMFRQSLEGGRGMLFLFEQAEHLKFWMKNTYIPLDIIFIGADRRIVGIEESCEPLTLTPRGPDEDSQFVLEVPGGWTRAHGVEQGQNVRFVGVD
jgi:uncharacterized membrane protein (UPF0127 family)